MSTSQIKGSQIADGSITSADISDALEKDFTKVRITSNDSSSDFLSSKLVAGNNITLTVNGVSGTSQTLTISSAGGGGGGGATSPGGSDTYVQFNDAGLFSGNSGLTYNKSSNTITSTILKVTNGLSGSLTKLVDGTSYLVAGSGVLIATGSTGSITISRSGSIDGDITGITAGSGLLGGGLSGSVDLSINNSIVATVSGTTFTGDIKVAPLTLGSVLFASSSGQLSQNNSNFFWDNTNKYLGIGTAIPSRPLHISAPGGWRTSTAANASGFEFINANSSTWRLNPVGTASELELYSNVTIPTNESAGLGFNSSAGQTKDTLIYRSAAGTLSLSGSAPGFLLKWLTTSTPTTLGHLGMDIATGRPQAYIGGSAKRLAHTAEIAPVDSTYVTLSNDATLTNERSLAVGNGILFTDGGPGASVILSIDSSKVAMSSGSTFTGNVKFSNGLSGSITNLSDGSSYLIEGSGISIASGSTGSITISGKFLGGSYVESGALGGQYGAVISTVCPIDDTIPQLSEGQVILTTPSYTMKSATSKLKITAHVIATCTAGYTFVVHTHRDSTANAEAVTRIAPPGNQYPTEANLSYRVDSPGAGTALVYKVVVGAQVAGQPISVNGAAGSRNFGGKYLSTLSIEEYEV